MKAIACADIHLDITNRFEDTKSVLRQILKYVTDNEIDTVFILGDIYDRKRPYNSEKVVFCHFVKYLSDRGVNVVMIAGNHDTDATFTSTIEEFRILELPHVRLVDNKTVVNYGNFKIFLGHLLLNEAKLGPADYQVGSSTTLKKILKDYEADIYLLGDVHKAQRLSKTPPVIYVGSPERINFGERKEPKGITLIEANEEIVYSFVPLKIRPMIQIETDDINGWVNTDIQDVTDALVKLRIKCSEEEYRNVNERGILKQLENAYDVKLEYDVYKDTRTRNATISESEEPAKCFENYADFIKMNKATKKLGLKIIAETK